MADLQVCYFCGSGPGDSLGEYAVVPPDLDPTDERQRSVVLCTECRRKLTTVMEPVVEAAEAYAGTGVSDDPPAGTEPTDPDFEVGPPGNVDAPAGAAEDDVPGANADADADGDEGDGVAAATTAGSDEVDVPPPSESVEGSDVGDDGVSIDAGGGYPDDEQGPDEESRSTAGEESGASGDAETTPSPDRTPPHADDELVGHNNAAYNKTLRLLQNREFPVERHEIEQVAANAYQLDPQEVSDAIDSLIQKGLLSQEGAHLQRP